MDMLPIWIVALFLLALTCAILYFGSKIAGLKRRNLAQAQVMRLHKLLAGISDPGMSFSGKLAAAHELRRFGAHRELILATCNELRFVENDPAAQKIREILEESLDRLRAAPE